MQDWQPLAKAAIVLGISRQKLWRKLDYVRHCADRHPGVPQMGIHWRYDAYKCRYLIDVSRPDLKEVFNG